MMASGASAPDSPDNPGDTAMHRHVLTIGFAAAALLALAGGAAAGDDRYHDGKHRDYHADSGYYDRNGKKKDDDSVQLGPRPFYLVDGMDEGKLKDRLKQCEDGPFYRSDFSIGHRGAPLQFPEHTKESYEAAARTGAGIIECDVTFTRDGELVCRHAECDLHTTTNIVATELNSQCSVPYSGPGSSPRCCASDLTLSQFRSLIGKMDASNPAAANAAGYLGGTANWRTDVYTGRGTLLTHAESITLIKDLGGKFTPELKSGDPVRVNAVFGSQAGYAQRLVDDYLAAGIPPRDVWPQSFNVEDVLYWVDHTAFGKQAVYLLDYNAADPVNDIVIQPPYNAMDRADYFGMLKKRGVRIIAPPMPALLAVEADGRIVPSKLARDLRRMGFDIITWTFERSDLRRGASRAGFYYDFDPSGAAIRKDSDMYKALDVLAREVKILGIFSDWPATVTYYANCMGLK
jgi:glycerophosphoryl diester phosphodiesterase